MPSKHHHPLVTRLFLALALLFSAALANAEKKITWVGCGITKNAFTKTLAKAFEEKTSIKVNVRGGGALKGIRDVVGGRTEVGGSCRHALELPEEEGAILTHVAWDALVVIVPESNPVNNLTSDQLKSMLVGKVTNWKTLGGNDHKIEFYARRGKLSGVGRMFRALFFGDPDKAFTNTIEVPRSSGLVEMLIGKGEGTVGLSGASSAQKRPGIKMLALDGVSPTKANIQSGEYHLIRPLYYATNITASEETKQFVEFALSSEGQAIIASEGSVNLHEGKHLLDLFKTRFGTDYLSAQLQ